MNEIACHCFEEAVYFSAGGAYRNTLSFAMINLGAGESPSDKTALPSYIAISITYGDTEKEALVDTLEAAMAIEATVEPDWSFTPFAPDYFKKSIARATLTYTGRHPLHCLDSLSFTLKNIFARSAPGKAVICVALRRLEGALDTKFTLSVRRKAFETPRIVFHPDFNAPGWASREPGGRVALVCKVYGDTPSSDAVSNMTATVEEQETEVFYPDAEAPQKASLHVYPAEPEIEFVELKTEGGQTVAGWDVRYADAPHPRFPHAQPALVHAVSAGGNPLEFLGERPVAVLGDYAVLVAGEGVPREDDRSFISLIAGNRLGTLIQTVWCGAGGPSGSPGLLQAWSRSVRIRPGAVYFTVEWETLKEEGLPMRFINPQYARCTDSGGLWFDIHKTARKSCFQRAGCMRHRWRWEYALPDGCGLGHMAGAVSGKEWLWMPEVRYCDNPGNK